MFKKISIADQKTIETCYNLSVSKAILLREILKKSLQ